MATIDFPGKQPVKLPMNRQ